MEDLYLYNLFIFIASFSVVALASKQIGAFFARIKLPKITGYLFSGLIAGGFILGFVSEEAVHRLRFIDEIALAFIAFAAGNELFLPELRGRFKSIGWVTASLVIATFTLGSTAVFLLADFIPFMSGMPTMSLVAISILAGAILVARSPSSAIAIVNELRAKGPFTQVILGVTVIMDVVVIALFALSAAMADAFLTQASVSLSFIALIGADLLLALLFAFGLFKILEMILAIRTNLTMKTVLILLSGFGVFVLSSVIRDASHTNLPFEILIEPLLVCMAAGFLVNNYSKHRIEFAKILHDVGPIIFIAFFTLTGASLELDVLVSIWPIALALFVIRLVSIMIGSFAGGILAGDPMPHNRLKWMGFVTQAGVALGLAKEVSGEFPEFGNAFATMIIAVVVLNEMVGPIFFKYAINRVGEAHLRGEAAPFDGVRDALIFGLKAQAISLARQLQRHDWQVKLVCASETAMKELVTPDVDIHMVEDLSLTTLQKLDAEHADTLVSFLPDEQSYLLCELAYEHFGIETMVVRLRERTNFDRFHKLGVMVVEPQTAVVSLLEHFVRSPAGTSLLLGMEDGQDVIDLEVRDPDLHGMALRDLRLPLDVLILSIHRNGHTLVSRGHTQLHLGDKVTMVGPQEKLDEVMLRFDA
ncbi:MAG: cation:proton antiporter [Anaerolineae bacterium]